MTYMKGTFGKPLPVPLAPNTDSWDKLAVIYVLLGIQDLTVSTVILGSPGVHHPSKRQLFIKAKNM